MGVLKIIRENPEIFNVDLAENYSEIEAMRKIASMECKGHKIQVEYFEIRQRYTAICNLLNLGYRETAIDLSIKLIPKAEWYQQYKVAQDLCDILITHFYKYGNLETVNYYRHLYDRLTLILSCEHESKLLYGQAIYNYKHVLPIDVDELMKLLGRIKEKLPVDSLLYHYYYYQCRTLQYRGKELEKLYIEAIDYFKKTYFIHPIFTSIFYDELVRHYLKNDNLEKAQLLIQKQLNLLEPGTIRWFRSSLSYVIALLKLKDEKAKTICDLVFNHPKFQELPNDKKKEWMVVIKASY